MNKQKEEKLHQLAIQIEYQFTNSKQKLKLTTCLQQAQATPKYKLFQITIADFYGNINFILMDVANKKFAVTSWDTIAQATKRMLKWSDSLDTALASSYKEELGVEEGEEFAQFKITKMELKTVKVLSILESHSVTTDDMAKIDLVNVCDEIEIMLDTMDQLESMKEPKKAAKKAS